MKTRRGDDPSLIFAWAERHTMQVGMLAFLGPIGLPELVIIMVILILIFGANRLSGIGKGMGQAIRGFKDEIKTDDKAENVESRGPE
ncbi:MAG: twin-arginine translocase TatA/TatE family subunit [Acidobacteriota bacterium]|nr:twin-arginine translocase TatA/TatE family subunit [Acidobacteriota bacterium]